MSTLSYARAEKNPVTLDPRDIQISCIDNGKYELSNQMQVRTVEGYLLFQKDYVAWSSTQCRAHLKILQYRFHLATILSQRIKINIADSPLDIFQITGGIQEQGFYKLDPSTLELEARCLLRDESAPQFYPAVEISAKGLPIFQTARYSLFWTEKDCQRDAELVTKRIAEAKSLNHYMTLAFLGSSVDSLQKTSESAP
ncbi:MAG: hypothetical protein H6623_09080 [Bdellovibrionaceae bacterium]|nr:hypothetical protein [Pseudobdellovibrionaceae bacterium]